MRSTSLSFSVFAILMPGTGNSIPLWTWRGGCCWLQTHVWLCVMFFFQGLGSAMIVTSGHWVCWWQTEWHLMFLGSIWIGRTNEQKVDLIENLLIDLNPPDRLIQCCQPLFLISHLRNSCNQITSVRREVCTFVAFAHHSQRSGQRCCFLGIFLE